MRIDHRCAACLATLEADLGIYTPCAACLAKVFERQGPAELETQPLSVVVVERPRACSVLGCDKKYFSKGLCRSHYHAQPCLIRGCPRKRCKKGKGMSRRHYAQIYNAETDSSEDSAALVPREGVTP